MDQKAKLNAGYLGVDGVETVVYRARGAQGDQRASSIHAVRYAVSLEEVLKTDGYLTLADVIWEVTDNDMVNIRPEAGDVIERSNGDKWSVIDVQLIDFDRTWQFVTRKERT